MFKRNVDFKKMDPLELSEYLAFLRLEVKEAKQELARVLREWDAIEEADHEA